ncbi:MAG: CIA30 family protein [Synechococcaceae bacterium WB9_4xC_028]|nr:CIA30 family protein [Synechococcaceae bacterium WB9_4xC_028]
MTLTPPEPAADVRVIAAGSSFSEWASLNDTIMGGSSRAGCRLTSEGLVLEGEVVSEGGGFVSCRSPVYRPPLDLSRYRGLRLRVDGGGRTLKLAELIPGGLRWVAPLPTLAEGTTTLEIPFSILKPVVRAQPVTLPVQFQASALTRLQLLHSRFADDGSENSGYRAGSIQLLVRSIEAYR